MANRFFQPTVSPVEAGLRTVSGALSIGKQLQELRTKPQELALDKRRVGVAESVAETGRLSELRQTSTAETQQRADEIKLQKAEQEIKTIKKIRTPFSAGELANIEATFSQLSEAMGTDIAKNKGVQRYFNNVKNLSVAGVSRSNLYRMSKDNWNSAKKPILEDLQKNLEQAVSVNDVETQQKLTGAIDLIASGQILDVMFKDSARVSKELQEEGTEKARTAGLVAGAEAEAKGQIVKTGEKFIRPSTGEVIASGGEKSLTPFSSLAKLETDFKNNMISEIDFVSEKKKILNPKAKNKTELTANALAGDKEAQNILEEMSKMEVEIAERKGEAAAKGKIAGLSEAMDLDATAKAVLDGRETIENVRNTFGVPIQEVVRQKVLEVESDFNFVQPRAIVKSLNSSMMQQQKNRGMMGSFVKNINFQVDKLENRSRDIIKRVGVRALDVPWRELNTRFIGSGHERVFEGYMKEVSAEIAKLSQGSAASVAQLPEANRQEWERIHDVNLSLKELIIVLNGTREMANGRLETVDDEIKETIDKLGNVRKSGQAEKTPVEKPATEKTDDELKKSLGL